MTAIVTKSNIHTAAYSNIFDTINDRNNVPDPRTGTATTRNFVMNTDPLHKSIGFTGLPYIVVELPRVSYSKESIDSLHKFIEWKQGIIVRTARDGSAGTRADVGGTDMNTICDNLHKTFNSSSVKTLLSNWNMKKVKLETTDTDTLVLDDKYVFETRLELTSTVRLQTG